MTCTLTHSDLAQFTGSEHLHFNPLFGRHFSYTDGVQFLGAKGCGWLQDKILANLKFNAKLRDQDFVCITLKVNENKTAILTFDDGNDCVLVTEMIEHTDCTIPEIKFFFTNNVLMLSSEY